jgi:hypothetical protein
VPVVDHASEWQLAVKLLIHGFNSATSDAWQMAILDDYTACSLKFFAERRWTLKHCPICAKEFYSKSNSRNCGSNRCVTAHEFVALPSPKHLLELDTCAMRVREFYDERGFLKHEPFRIVRVGERTLFASTAGQIYDELIYGSSSQVCRDTQYVIQPVVRLQERESIPTSDGISTAFVHCGLESWNASPEDHFHNLDSLLDLLSNLGIYVGHLCLQIDGDDNDWSGMTVPAAMIRMNYAGLELGVANFFYSILQSTGLATLSDVGVGLERIVWAANKTVSYFDSIGPPSAIGKHKRTTLDAMRTATLVSAAGVRPGNKNHESKLRSLVQDFADSALSLNLFELVRYYYDQWTSFMKLREPFDTVYTTLWSEVCRHLNSKINDQFGCHAAVNRDSSDRLSVSR